MTQPVCVHGRPLSVPFCSGCAKLVDDADERIRRNGGRSPRRLRLLAARRRIVRPGS